MLVKPSPLVGAMSGAIGGIVFSLTKNGLIAGIRPTKTQPSTTFAISQRAELAHWVQIWRSLTSAERTTFIVAARSIFFSNRLGTRRAVTGYSLFLKLHIGRLPQNPEAMTGFSAIHASNFPSTSNQLFDWSDGLILSFPQTFPTDNTHIHIFSQATFNSNETRAPISMTRYLHIPWTAGPLFITSAFSWQQRFGYNPTGSVIHLRYVIMLKDSLPSPPVTFTGLVTP